MRGFTLIESAVALAVIGVALLAGVRAAARWHRPTPSCACGLAQLAADNRIAELRSAGAFRRSAVASAACPQEEQPAVRGRSEEHADPLVPPRRSGVFASAPKRDHMLAS